MGWPAILGLVAGGLLLVALVLAWIFRGRIRALREALRQRARRDRDYTREEVEEIVGGPVDPDALLSLPPEELHLSGVLAIRFDPGGEPHLVAPGPIPAGSRRRLDRVVGPEVDVEEMAGPAFSALEHYYLQLLAEVGREPGEAPWNDPDGTERSPGSG